MGFFTELFCTPLKEKVSQLKERNGELRQEIETYRRNNESLKQKVENYQALLEKFSRDDVL